MRPEIRDALRDLYIGDSCSRLVGFSGGKDSIMLASLVYEAALSVPPRATKHPLVTIYTDLMSQSRFHGLPDKLPKDDFQHEAGTEIIKHA